MCKQIDFEPKLVLSILAPALAGGLVGLIAAVVLAELFL